MDKKDFTHVYTYIFIQATNSNKIDCNKYPIFAFA